MTTLQEKILTVLEIDVLDIEAEIEESLPQYHTRWVVRREGIPLCEISNMVPESQLFEVITAFVPDATLEFVTETAKEMLESRTIEIDYF